jgi:hypothetical protein
VPAVAASAFTAAVARHAFAHGTITLAPAPVSERTRVPEASAAWPAGGVVVGAAFGIDVVRAVVSVTAVVLSAG